MNKKHFNIPIFIPELACPFQCIYCDQVRISGTEKLPTDEEIIGKIRSYLSTIPPGSEVQLAYFGGNFTGIQAPEQEHYLQLIKPYIEAGMIGSIRLSTRPDYITDDVLALLGRYHVRSIELGAQSFDDNVLNRSRRGHTAADTVRASEKIRAAGFSLGLQMMIGLPGDSLESSLHTAERIVELGASDTRIYPTLVIRGTVLEKMMYEDRYQPLELSKAVDWCAHIQPVFEEAGVNILKVGLHPSEGLLSGEELIAGPFHPSFRELVETELWRRAMAPLNGKSGKRIDIRVGAGQVNQAVGYRGANRKMLEKSFQQVKFTASGGLTGRSFQYEITE